MRHVNLISLLMGILAVPAVSLFNFQLDSKTMLVVGASLVAIAAVFSLSEKLTLAVLLGGTAVILSSTAAIIVGMEENLVILVLAVLLMVGSAAGIAFLSSEKWDASLGWAFARYLTSGGVGGIGIYLYLTQSNLVGMPVIFLVSALIIVLIFIVFHIDDSAKRVI